jgi:hypothetical protein
MSEERIPIKYISVTPVSARPWGDSGRNTCGWETIPGLVADVAKVHEKKDYWCQWHLETVVFEDGKVFSDLDTDGVYIRDYVYEDCYPFWRRYADKTLKV